MYFFEYFNNNQNYLTFIIFLIIFITLKFIFSYFFSQNDIKKTISINSILQPTNNIMMSNNNYKNKNLSTCPVLTCPKGYKNVIGEEEITCDCDIGYVIVNIESNKYNKKFVGTCAIKCNEGYEHVEYNNNLVCAPKCKENYQLVDLENNGNFTCQIICKTLKCPSGFKSSMENNVQTCIRE